MIPHMRERDHVNEGQMRLEMHDTQLTFGEETQVSMPLLISRRVREVNNLSSMYISGRFIAFSLDMSEDEGAKKSKDLFRRSTSRRQIVQRPQGWP